MKKGLLIITGIFLIALLFFFMLKFLIIPQLRGEELPVLGPPGHKISPFTLFTQDSVLLNSDSLKGKILIVDFFFTRCPSICPTLSRNMKNIQDKLSGINNVVLLSFTVDPEHDTPSILKKYSEKYGATPGKWIFLTGEKKQVYDICINSFLVPVMEGQQPQDFIHTDRIVLVDGKGQIRQYYNGLDTNVADLILRDVLKLLKKS